MCAHVHYLCIKLCGLVLRVHACMCYCTLCVHPCVCIYVYVLLLLTVKDAVMWYLLYWSCSSFSSKQTLILANTLGSLILSGQNAEHVF